ncbi:ubiquinol--cytochrome-c reductase subunit [Maudiozyma humilis]|uniref:Ubiquinol--cytochrome-c reductase subunit n=1 Tax=Maudiozyma humilis TaxID=51915 RepID=A0AAV5S8P5_MAUHU|nr:ubiquinol--cytochrome-c reductase subunit [Kazachstania humilis]
MLRTTTARLARRSLATHAGAAASAGRLEITELSNGLTVASEHNPAAATASVGVVYSAGSTAENPYNNGVSNLWATYFGHGSSAVQAAAAKQGLRLSANVARESQAFTVQALPGDASKALGFLQQHLLAKESLSDSDFAAVQKTALAQLEEFEDSNHAERVLEHLHATAFQNTPLALPTRGTLETVESLIPQDMQSFAAQQFHAKNATVVATGNVAHDELVKAVEAQVSLNAKSGAAAAASAPAKSSFLGSEVRLRDDTLPSAWISLAVEGESQTSPDYLTAAVAASIFGSYVAAEPASRLQGIKLLDDIQEYHLADSFVHYSKSYRDTGLWGFSTQISNVSGIDDMIHFTLKQWNRLSISITDTELERGKALLKLKLGNANIQRAADAALLGAEVVQNGGRYLNTAETFKKIDALTVSDIKKWAGNRLWDQDIAIAGAGQIEDLLDYMRMRNDMSMMRW